LSAPNSCWYIQSSQLTGLESMATVGRIGIDRLKSNTIESKIPRRTQGCEIESRRLTLSIHSSPIQHNDLAASRWLFFWRWPAARPTIDKPSRPPQNTWSSMTPCPSDGAVPILPVLNWFMQGVTWQMINLIYLDLQFSEGGVFG
jgi:hypothetical protein